MLTRVALAVGLVLGGLATLRGAPPVESSFHPQSMAYVLQADKFSKTKAEAVRMLSGCGRDAIVIDPLYGGRESWSAADIGAIRAGKAGRRVLAYLSIGEAENYRDYWNKKWDADKNGHPDASAPKFLCDENPDWPGNYKVKYWHADWQRIALRQLDGILAQGFDGAYLDVVDGFEYFENVGNQSIDNRPNAETGHTYRQDMADWVEKIAAHARARRPAFLIVPQNGSQLVDLPGYLRAIDALGIEDLFTDGDKQQPAEDTRYVLEYLNKAQQAGKPILLIEYSQSPKARKWSIEGARQHGLTLLLTDRQLTTLGTLPGR